MNTQKLFKTKIENSHICRELAPQINYKKKNGG